MVIILLNVSKGAFDPKDSIKMPFMRRLCEILRTSFQRTVAFALRAPYCWTPEDQGR